MSLQTVCLLSRCDGRTGRRRRDKSTSCTVRGQVTGDQRGVGKVERTRTVGSELRGRCGGPDVSGGPGLRGDPDSRGQGGRRLVVWLFPVQTPLFVESACVVSGTLSERVMFPYGSGWTNPTSTVPPCGRGKTQFVTTPVGRSHRSRSGRSGHVFGGRGVGSGAAHEDSDDKGLRLRSVTDI